MPAIIQSEITILAIKNHQMFGTIDTIKSLAIIICLENRFSNKRIFPITYSQIMK